MTSKKGKKETDVMFKLVKLLNADIKEQRTGQDSIVSYMEKKFDKLGSQIIQIFAKLDRLEVDRNFISSKSDDNHEEKLQPIDGKFDMIFDDLTTINCRIQKLENKSQSPRNSYDKYGYLSIKKSPLKITEEEMKILDQALQIEKHAKYIVTAITGNLSKDELAMLVSSEDNIVKRDSVARVRRYLETI